MATATVLSTGERRPPVYSVRASSLGNAVLWLAAFSSGFVIREPAPYELFMVGVLFIWLLCGLKLRPEFGPLIICMMLYSAGGIAAVPLADNLGDAALYIAVTAFLAATSIFFAAVICQDPRRYKPIQNGYVLSSLFVALAGIIGYFQLLPGTDYFTLYDRARGTFQDPNVFGPFLALPTVLFVRRLLTENLSRNLMTLVVLPILILGIFLSFSRGAWMVVSVATIIVYLLAFLTDRNPMHRFRMLVLAVLGCVGLMALLAAALSIGTVADMFEQRARLVQDYDSDRLGRFARYVLGFEMVMERPFGLGPLQFNKYFPEDEHNVYLKGFTTYGWLGGVTFLVFTLWTMRKLAPLVFKMRPWTPFVQCLFAVMVAHALLGLIIDTDHWRHVFMMYGVAWGFIAADALETRKRHKMWSLARAQQSGLHAGPEPAR
ncbi:O-antigen ligase domain-containing protein [Roseibium hamelinense]|nr:O-antigen ligase domain-containing protein [Roseibium hamelinense]